MNPHAPRLLLCTDMDRTIIPNGAQPEHSLARQRFSEFCALPWVTLVYVTGRHFELVHDAISEYTLPEPDYIVSDVGTKIFAVREGESHQMMGWYEDIDKDWQGKTHADLERLFSDLTVLQLQEGEKQSVHKLSYYVALNVDHVSLMQEMEQRLNKNAVHASLVWSIDEPENIGLLDVLPKNATKVHAVEYLQKTLGYGIHEVVFAGDSGNDLPVMASTIPSVLVANASPDVRSSAYQLAESNHALDALYLASGEKSDMDGNYSAGVLEGVGYFFEQSHEQLNKLGFCYE